MGSGIVSGLVQSSGPAATGTESVAENSVKREDVK